MADRRSLEHLDALREYAANKMDGMGRTAERSPLTARMRNSAQMRTVLAHLLVVEAALWSSFDETTMEPHWQASLDELWSDLDVQIAADLIGQRGDVLTDADVAAKEALKAFHRVVPLMIQQERAGT